MTHRGGGGRGAPVASLIEISRVLEETARIVREHAVDTVEVDGIGAGRQFEAAGVRAIIAFRRLRREFLGYDATETAWAMLLELYAARLEGRRVSQTRLGAAVGLPATTGRHVARRLLARGLLVWHPGSGPGRNAGLLDLSEETERRIAAYLAAAADLAPLVA
jgi:hypothetical protein